jgi:hypothetical protein
MTFEIPDEPKYRYGIWVDAIPCSIVCNADSEAFADPHVRLPRIFNDFFGDHAAARTHCP